MTELDALLAGIVADPREETRWLVLADWLQEYDDPRRAELLRLHRRMLATCCEPDAHPQRAEWQTRMVELLVAGVRPCVPQETLTLPGGVPMTFAFIPEGAFLMGGEKAAPRVEVSRGFFLGVYPVTQAQWAAVMGTDPSHFKGLEHPVDSLSWNDCRDFCARLSASTGRRVELPTEAEWECACRAGTTTEYHFGDRINTNLVNYDGNYSWNGSPKGKYRESTTAVGSFPPNPWGLYDVHGNVWEWCADYFGPDLTGGESSETTTRAMRGGCWDGIPSYCRTVIRYQTTSTHRTKNDGVRVCLRLD